MMWHINEIELSNPAPISIYILLLLSSLTVKNVHMAIDYSQS